MRSTTRDAGTIQSEFDTYAALAQSFAGDPSNAQRVESLARVCADAVRGGGKLLAVGNGASCADAVHFCEELTGRYRDDRAPIPAIACSDAGHITCVGNDYGFDSIFSRWVQGLGRKGDVLIALSTSGNSANIVRAIDSGQRIGMHTVTLLGKGGGQLAGVADTEWVMPGQTSDRIQELHMLVLHALVGAIERNLSDS
ncbi:MAG TPA: phosphoheptose isomerase [Phycisphaerales bacterium]|nr:phosphoheptose isomerase [Phycisphaerales bacterium]